MCAAILDALCSRNKMFTFSVFREIELIARLKIPMNELCSEKYISQLYFFIKNELLILDDVFSFKRDQCIDDLLDVLIDFRYTRNLPTVFSIYLSSDEVKRIYGERIHSRLFATENTIINTEGMPNYRKIGK